MGDKGISGDDGVRVENVQVESNGGDASRATTDPRAGTSPTARSSATAATAST